MPSHITVSDPLDLLCVVPELVGFEPRNSLVIVVLGGRVALGALRVDLPHAELPAQDLAGYVTTVLDLARRVHGADALLPIVFTDAEASERPPQLRLAGQLRSQAAAVRLPVHELLYVARDVWGRYGGSPRPRREVDAARELRRLDPDARSVADTPALQSGLPVADPTCVAKTMTVLGELEDGSDTDSSLPDPLWFGEYSAGWKPDDIGPSAAALTAHVLSRPWARDVVLFTWAWGPEIGRRAQRFQERWRRGQPVRDRQIALALAGQGTIGRPTVTAVEHGIAVLREVASRLPSERRAPVLSSLAWLAWTLGRSSVAGEYVRRARQCDDDYGFAELVETMLDRGMLPDWAFGGAGRSGGGEQFGGTEFGGTGFGGTGFGGGGRSGGAMLRRDGRSALGRSPG